VLEAETYALANELARTLPGGKGISRQAWALKETILEVEELNDPRVIEVPPEVAWRRADRYAGAAQASVRLDEDHPGDCSAQPERDRHDSQVVRARAVAA
jgi:predicted RNase H-like nuclease